MKKAIAIFRNILIIFIALVTVFTIFISLPLRTPFKAFVVTSGSMRPKIPEGSVVVVSRDTKNLKVDDVITFVKPDNFSENVTHRIIEITQVDGKTMYKTKGDANNIFDLWLVRPESTWGKVMFHIPFVGHIIGFSKTKIGSIVVFVIPALLIIISEIITVFKEAKKLKTKSHQSKKEATLVILLFISLSSIGFTFSRFTDRTTAVYNTVTSKCWLRPTTPVLNSPLNQLITNQNNQVFSWLNSTSSCGIATMVYNFQLYSDAMLTHLASESGWITPTSYNPGNLTDGHYWWRVQAKDQFDNINTGNIFELMIDTVAPSSAITSDFNSQTVSVFNIGYTLTSPNLSPIDYVQLCYSYNMGNSVCDPNFRDDGTHGSISFKAANDGLYDFYVYAVDKAGNTEIKSIPELTVQIDTKAPTTNLVTPQTQPQWSGDNLVTNGNFESGMAGWTVATPQGDHHITSSGSDVLGAGITAPSGNEMFELGFHNSPNIPNTSDAVYQIVPVPQNLSANLSFWFRTLSQDIVDYSSFNVYIKDSSDKTVEEILSTGSQELGGGGSTWTGDSGWRQISRSLLSYAGQTIKLWFELNNKSSDPDKKSWAYLDDVKVSTLDTRIGDTTTITIEQHDTGSGVGIASTDVALTVGENTINHQATDILGNVGTTQASSIVVLPPLALNKLHLGNTDSDKIEVFNNTLASVNTTGWYLQNSSGATVPLTATDIGPTGSLNINVGHTSFLGLSNAISLHQSGSSTPADTTSFSTTISTPSLWQRTPAGVGTWNLIVLAAPTPVLNANLVSRLEVNKITLSVNGITTLPLNYEIIYTSNSDDKGIFGKITEGSSASRDFYLGTCSTGGACTPEPNIGTSATVNLTTDVGTTLMSKVFTLTP